MARVQKGGTLFRPKKKPGPKPPATANPVTDDATIAPATPAATQSQDAPSMAPPAIAVPSPTRAPPTPAPTQKKPPSLVAAAAASPAADDGTAREFVPRPGSMRRSATPRASTPGAASTVFRNRLQSTTPAPDGPSVIRMGSKRLLTPDDEPVPLSRPGMSRPRNLTPEDQPTPIGRSGQKTTAPLEDDEDAVPLSRPGERSDKRAITRSDDDEAVPLSRPGARPARNSDDEEAVPLTRPGASKRVQVSDNEALAVPVPPSGASPANDTEAVPLARPGARRPMPFNTFEDADAATLSAALDATASKSQPPSGVNSVPNAASSSRHTNGGTPLVFKKRADGTTMAVPDPAGPARPRGRPKTTPAGETRAQTAARKRAEYKELHGTPPKRARKQRSDAGSKRPKRARGSVGVDDELDETGSEAESVAQRPSKGKRRKGIPNDRLDVDGLDANEMVGEEVDLSQMSMADLTRAHDYGRISGRAITIQKRKAELHPAKEEARKRAAAQKAAALRKGEIRQIKIRNYMRQQRRAELEQGVATDADRENGVSDDEEIIEFDPDEEDDVIDDGDEEAMAERKRRRAALLAINEAAKTAAEPEAPQEPEEEMDLDAQLENMEFEDHADAEYFDSDRDEWVDPAAERLAVLRQERDQALEDEINDSDAEAEEIRDTDTWVNQASFLPKGKSARGRKWNKQESEALYMALSMFGESASIIHETVFQYMTLGQVKGKLRRENLERPHKVTEALRNKVKLDRQLLSNILGLNLDVAQPEHETPLPNAVKKMSEEPEPTSEAEMGDDTGRIKASASQAPREMDQPPTESVQTAETAEDVQTEAAP